MFIFKWYKLNEIITIKIKYEQNKKNQILKPIIIIIIIITNFIFKRV